MENNKESLSNIPSLKLDLLSTLKGRQIVSVIRYCIISTDEATSEMYRIPHNQVFSRAPGPIIITFDDHFNIGCASAPSLNSVITWMVRPAEIDPEEEELYPVNALDTTFSSTFWRDIVGHRIVDVKIIKMKPRNALYQYLPNEVGIKIYMSNASRFILSHGLHDGSDDFSAITEDLVSKKLKPLLFLVDI